MRKLVLTGLAVGTAATTAVVLAASTGGSASASSQNNYPWHGQTPSGSAAASSSSQTSSDSGTKETIVLIAHQTNFAFADANNDQKFDAPDFFVFREKDKSKSGDVLGFDMITCHVNFHQNTDCVGAAVLAGGQVSVGGIVPNSNEFDIPIIGGTGEYRDATGQAHVKNLNNNTSEIDLELDS